ncbi:MAG: DUF3299 domain-containing protein [Succinivibrionaceae bacterium]|nr:DUF3299 domain-containing protein [Succinivibrionaceae bacterium]
MLRSSFITAVFLLLALLFSTGSCAAATADTVVWNDLIDPAALAANSAEGVTDAAGIERVSAGISEAGINTALLNREIILTGFAVPVDYDDPEHLRSFLLVPYMGACIHVPPPPENQIIMVTLKEPRRIKAMDQVQIKGVLRADSSTSGSDRDDLPAASGYSMDNAQILNLDEERNICRPLAILFLAGMVLSLGLILPLHRIRLAGAALSLIHSLAGGIMLCIGLFTLVSGFSAHALAAFFAGFMLIYLINALFSHSCCCEGECSEQDGKFTVLALVIHNIPEYFMVLATLVHAVNIGMMLVVSLLMHNIPLSLSVGLSLRNLSFSGRIKYIFLLSILPVILAAAVYLCLDISPNSDNYRLLLSGIGGVITYVAVFNLSGRNLLYGNRKAAAAGTVLGTALSLAGLLLFRL